MRLDLIRQTAVELRTIVDVDASALMEVVREPANAGVQPEVIEDGGAQELRELAHAGNGLFHQLQAIVDAGAVRRTRGDRSQVGLDGGERPSQLVVKFVREAAGGGLLR